MEHAEQANHVEGVEGGLGGKDEELKRRIADELGENGAAVVETLLVEKLHFVAEVADFAAVARADVEDKRGVLEDGEGGGIVGEQRGLARL